MKHGWPDVLYFLNVVAKIPTRLEEENVNGFIRGVEIRKGCIHFDGRGKISDVLHEAGHIAIMPSRYRKSMSGDISSSIRRAWDDAKLQGPLTVERLTRALLQCSDPEATAWAWAAGVHIGLQPEQIIPDSDDPIVYGGDAAGVRFAHTLSGTTIQPLGAHGLAAAGFCQVGMLNPHNPLPRYPKLAFWTQEIE